MNRWLVLPAVVLSTLAFSCGAATTRDLAPLNVAPKGEEVVTSSSGLKMYMIDILPNEQESYSSQIDEVNAPRFSEKDPPSVQNMVVSFEQEYGFTYDTVTSWVGNSISAFLTLEQVAAIQRDPRVTQISEVVFATLSSGPPWADSTHSGSSGTETIPWGRTAVNGKTSNGTGRVYIIDGGVGLHEDLTSVALRASAGCGPNNVQCPSPTSTVDCIGHPTMVAGIIGAKYGNLGTAGVNAGVSMRSLSALPTRLQFPPHAPFNCLDEDSLTAASVANAMDFALWDIVTTNFQKVAVINISINSTAFAPGGSLNAKMLNLATPHLVGGAFNYRGAFIAQSAGNEQVVNCPQAFGYSSHTPNVSDGIMVVGAIDSNGNAVYASSGNGFLNEPWFSDEKGSNYGTCLDVWAPGLSIYSSINALPYDGNLASTGDTSTLQLDNVTYHNYTHASGTSFAAPHIAGVASYLQEQNNYSTPAALETAVRALFYNVGKVDHGGNTIWMVQLP